MQALSEEDRVSLFLEKKYRYSKSFGTKQTYGHALKKFCEFLSSKYGLSINDIVIRCEAKTLDPIVVLDNFYSYLSDCKQKNGIMGYSNATITTCIAEAKELLN